MLSIFMLTIEKCLVKSPFSKKIADILNLL